MPLPVSPFMPYQVWEVYAELSPVKKALLAAKRVRDRIGATPSEGQIWQEANRIEAQFLGFPGWPPHGEEISHGVANHARRLLLTPGSLRATASYCAGPDPERDE